jgi:ABC-2 type transport system ATP-binding protein
VTGVSAETVKARLSDVPNSRKAAIVKEDGSTVWVRVYPKSAGVNGLARSVGEVASQQGWRVEELHTEEGRLDEVFRSITVPDTQTPAQT